MLFENKIRNTPFISCENGTETLEKRITIDRAMADDFNRVISVMNAETDLKFNARLLFEILFTDFKSAILKFDEDTAVEFIKQKAEALKND